VMDPCSNKKLQFFYLHYSIMAFAIAFAFHYLHHLAKWQDPICILEISEESDYNLIKLYREINIDIRQKDDIKVLNYGNKLHWSIPTNQIFNFPLNKSIYAKKFDLIILNTITEEGEGRYNVLNKGGISEKWRCYRKQQHCQRY
jgi:hypothetical protein